MTSVDLLDKHRVIDRKKKGSPENCWSPSRENLIIHGWKLGWPVPGDKKEPFVYIVRCSIQILLETNWGHLPSGHFCHRTRPEDTRGCRRRVTCPMGDSLWDCLGIGVTGYRHGSGLFHLSGAEAAGWSRRAVAALHHSWTSATSGLRSLFLITCRQNFFVCEAPSGARPSAVADA
ncbi:hypothetical protein EVAR_64393_1 [Eumeta japonica]|uniref:Uncharacterized protein n=1 Tax=Eumeta variegata TaxID=151549 RepID=A0A4C1SJT7_EUMVA|nr:hypothetical protein EVAR_64393_1 [Eumeta japonica]